MNESLLVVFFLHPLTIFFTPIDRVKRFPFFFPFGFLWLKFVVPPFYFYGLKRLKDPFVFPPGPDDPLPWTRLRWFPNTDRSLLHPLPSRLFFIFQAQNTTLVTKLPPVVGLFFRPPYHNFCSVVGKTPFPLTLFSSRVPWDGFRASRSLFFLEI